MYSIIHRNKEGQCYNQYFNYGFLKLWKSSITLMLCHDSIVFTPPSPLSYILHLVFFLLILGEPVVGRVRLFVKRKHL